MISRCTEADAQEILGFIGDDYGRCLYLYLDMIRYGFNTPFVSLWRQNFADGSLSAVWLRYHSGMHVYAPHGYADADEAAAFVRSEHPAMLCGVPDVLKPIEAKMAEDGYAFHGGTVCRYDHRPDGLERIELRLADRDEDFNRIGEMLYSDPDYGASFSPGELASQLQERYRLGQGRSYVGEFDGTIVVHGCVAAECDQFALLNGGITDPRWRHKGVCTRLLFTMSDDLTKAGKRVYSMYYNPIAAALHRKAGYVDCCAWGRLFIKTH